MEVMGTWEMQNICVAGYSESCWTDRLQKRGLPHPEHCPLCDQEEENIQHILISCVIATCKAILVCHLAAHKLESVDTHKECEFC